LFFTNHSVVWRGEGALGKKRKQLDLIVTAIQQRWGTKALQRGSQALHTAVTVSPISTSFPQLDQVLDGIGGIPRGRITEILAQPTSGMTTLALKIITKAQAAGDLAIYLDLGQNFDPDYAVRCGLNLAQLRLIRPPTGSAALEIVQTLITHQGAGVIVFDSVAQLLAGSQGTQTLAAGVRQLLAGLAQSTCALVFLTPLTLGGAMSPANYPSGFALPHYATLRLQLKKENWIYKGRDVRGYEAQVIVLKNQLGRAGQRAKIAITFNGVVRGDST
jgi:recombination protein RecA